MDDKELELKEQEKIDGNEDYIETIKKLKENSVSKDEYAKLKEENKKLLQSLVNGEQVQPQTKKVDIQELRNDLFNKENNNLDYVTKALELRDALIDQGFGDPFIPAGSNIVASTADIEAANRVADALKGCVEYANGDSQIFTSELMRITADTKIPPRRN